MILWALGTTIIELYSILLVKFIIAFHCEWPVHDVNKQDNDYMKHSLTLEPKYLKFNNYINFNSIKRPKVIFERQTLSNNATVRSKKFLLITFHF